MALPKYSAKYANSWAVVVGINAYKHASPLGYACNDATAFAQQLTTRFGFPEANVAVLLDKDATLQSIRKAVHELVRKSSDDDRVIVFYAGHGVTAPARGLEAGFLVPVDGDSDDTSTLLPWDDLVSTSRMIRAKHMLFVMDACYGGLIGTRAVPPGSRRLVRDMLSRYSRQFLTAGKADETVADCGGPRNGHSVFTGHLLEALDGGLQAADGVISASSVMNYVYDRVSKDAHSQQTPHYGFLTGDGDLFFSAPDVDTASDKAEETGNVMVQVPPDLAAPEETEVAPTPIEQVKIYLSDQKYLIPLDELVKRELRKAQQRLGEENFSVQGGLIGAPEFAERLLKYEDAMGDLLRMCVLAGRWAHTAQQLVLTQVVGVLAGEIEVKGGLTLWLSLRSYPMLLAMYAGGIAAVDAENYESLRTLLFTEVPAYNHDHFVPVVQSVTDAMLDVRRTDAFKTIPGFDNKYTPQSEYLFARMQPIIEDLLFLGKRYDLRFDRFEIFYALCYADASDDYWGHPGRFAWKYRSRGRAPDSFSALVEEAKRAGEKWAPLKAGLFQGSYSRFATVAERFKSELLDKLPWH